VPGRVVRQGCQFVGAAHDICCLSYGFPKKSISLAETNGISIFDDHQGISQESAVTETFDLDAFEAMIDHLMAGGFSQPLGGGPQEGGGKVESRALKLKSPRR
jgi:hypothetical protein